MTDRKRGEQAIVRLNERLRNANRDLEEFTSSVCHDLPRRFGRSTASRRFSPTNTPRPSTRPAKELLRPNPRRGPADERHLIDDLMKLSRVGRAAVRREPVDLSPFVRTIADALRRSEPQRDVEFAIPQGMTAVGDPNLLRVAFDNLLGNAWKYTGKHDQARIEFGTAESRWPAEFTSSVMTGQVSTCGRLKNSSGSSSGCTGPRILRAPASAWLRSQDHPCTRRQNMGRG